MRSAVGRAAVLTGLINVLALTGSCYLLAIYDCVLPAQSTPLLISLSLAAAGLHIVHGLLDALRSRLLCRGGGALHAALRDGVFSAIQLLPLRVRHIRDPLLPVRDLDQVRAFLSGAGATALLDLPWVPGYLAAVYLLSPALGIFALGGVAVVGSLALIADALTSGAYLEVAKRNALRLNFCETVVRDVEAARAMGPGALLQSRWRGLSDAHAAHHEIALDAAGAFAGAAKAARLIVQSGILGFGAYLLMRAEISAGAMMAASILMSRALAPIEAASAHWRGLAATRQSYRRLSALFEALAMENADPQAGHAESAGKQWRPQGSSAMPGRCSST
jgi:ATP-binding cassette subfamily C protein